MHNSIAYFREHLKNTDEISFYQEGNTLLSRLPDCPGFIKYPWGINFSEIVVDEDAKKLLSEDKVIKNILSEEWGDFEEEIENLLLKSIHLFDSLPYFVIHKFKKRNDK